MRITGSTSFFIDIVRILFTQAVIIGHALSFLEKNPANAYAIPTMQSVGVSVLFILSGFLIAHSCHSKKSDTAYGLKQYITSRTIRVYTILIPALLMITVLDLITINLAPATYKYYDAFTFRSAVSTMLMLQDYPLNPNLWLFRQTSFASARQLWTLPIEWSLYILFGLVFYRTTLQKTAKVKMAYFPVMVLVGIIPIFNSIGGRGNGLAFTWLVGVVCYYALLHLSKNTSLGEMAKKYKGAFFALLAVLCMGLGFWRLVWIHRNFGINYDPLFSLLTGLSLLLWLLLIYYSPLRIGSRLQAFVKVLSSYSFSLYVTHYSLQVLLLAVFSEHMSKRALFILLLFACNIFAFLFSLPFERFLPFLIKKAMLKEELPKTA